MVSGKRGDVKAGGSLWKKIGEHLRDLMAGKIFFENDANKRYLLKEK